VALISSRIAGLAQFAAVHGSANGPSRHFAALQNLVVLADWRLLGHLGPAMLKAPVFTKCVLIGEHLKLGARFEQKPLIWIILVKAALFSALLIGLDFLEAVASNAIWPNAAPKGNGEIDLINVRVVLSFSFPAFVALIPFFGIMELGKLIGRDQMRDFFPEPYEIYARAIESLEHGSD
jgi:hypothetical protein